MTGKQLKNAILQLAIQGKLVPQDAADEPASALLARIRKEKEQLVKAGKLKKKDLETTPITDEEKPFEIPESWEWVRLGEISTYACTKKKINAADAASQLWGLDLEDIEKGGRLLNRETVGERKAIGDKTFFNKGDILYSKLRPYLLKILVAPEEGICTPEIIPFSCFGDIDKEFIVNVLKSSYVDDYINSVTFGIKMPRVGTETMTSLLIPLPPLAEQHRIVSKIEELMPLVEEYGAAQEKLNRLNEVLPEALKKSILQQAIQGKLVPQDPADEPASALLAQIRKEKEQLVKAGKLKKKDLETTPITDEEKPFEIPESWEWVRLGEIFKINMGQSPTGDAVSTAKNGIEFHQGKIKFGDKYIGVSDFTTTKPNKIAEPLDLLLCVRAPVGEVNITERKICIGRGLCGLTPTGKMPVNFWFYAMKTLIPIFNAKATGSTFVAISNDIIVNQIIPLPPLAEQHRIVAKIEELLAMVDGMNN